MTREDAIRIIRKMLAYTDLSVRANLTADMVDACHMAIKALEQEPQTGRWIESDAVLVMGYSETDNFLRIPAKECSVCHKPHIRAYRMNYCPHCGAKMAESEAEDGKDD